jgi:hypothetical protein
MFDAAQMSNLSTQLVALKGVDAAFGGMTVIFVGDFCQLPTVAGSDLWKKPARGCKKPLEVARGHELWRSLNAVVLLEEQMRQSEDIELQDLLRALRNRRVEERHLRLLRSHVATSVDDIEECEVIIVRRNDLRHALNDHMVHSNAERQNVKVLYAPAQIVDPHGMSVKEILSKRATSDILGDSVLALIPDVPLMITENLDVKNGRRVFIIDAD